jgi:hypothetical protein
MEHGAHFQVLPLERDDNEGQLDFNYVPNTKYVRSFRFEPSEA